MHDQDNAEERLQFLHDLRGSDLVAALVKELGELQREVSQLQREMAAYRDYQATRDRWLTIDAAQKTRAQLPKSVTIDASQSLQSRQGFYGLEYGGKGIPFCWTGPSQNFSFDIFVDRSRGAELELRALSCINFERQKAIKLLVNGESVPATVTRNGTGFVLKAELPARDDDRGTNLVFCVPEVLSPAGSTADKRKLGVAFQALSVNARSEPSAGKPRKSDDTVVTLTRSGASKQEAAVNAPAAKPDAAAS